MDMTKALTMRAQRDDGAGPAQARRGQCNDCVVTEVMRERKDD
jgi:hypothetical protein